jgi:hypothetical protein
MNMKWELVEMLKAFEYATSSGWSDDGEFDTLEVAKCYKTPDGRIMKIHVTSEEVE